MYPSGSEEKKGKGKGRRGSDQSRKSVVDVIREAVGNWPTPAEVLTTLPGFSDVSAVPQIGAKVFWAIFTIGALVVTGFQLYEIIRDYRKSPTTTSVSEKMSYLTPVPSMIICPLMPFNITYLEQNGLSRDYARLLLATRMSAAIPDSVQSILKMPKDRILAAGKEFDDYSLKTGKSLEQQLFDIGTACESFFQFCWFSYRVYPCCSMTKPIMTEFGKCFMKYPMRGTRGIVGPQRSYHMTLSNRGRLTASDHERIIQDSTEEIPTYPDGITVTLLNDRNEPNIHESLNYLRPGFNGMVGIKRIRYNIKKGKRGCSERERLTYYSTPYNRFDCQEECVFNATFDACGCGTTGVSGMDMDKVASKFCHPLKSAQCIVPKMFGNNKDTAMLAKIEACKKECTPKCSFWQYRLTHDLNTIVPRPEMKQNGSEIILLTVYNKAKTWTSIDEIDTLTWSGMIGSLGGVLGLWLGIQIASLVQLSFYTLVGLAKQIRKKPGQTDTGTAVRPFPLQKF